MCCLPSSKIASACSSALAAGSVVSVQPSSIARRRAPFSTNAQKANRVLLEAYPICGFFSALIFDCFQCVETLSTVFTLLPGTIITTGTPGGTGAVARLYLKAGDVVKIAIDGLGEIENTVIPEPATATL